MSAPVLSPIEEIPPKLQERLPSVPDSEDASLFVVLRSGSFGGQHWVPGEVLVCRGTAYTGDAVVLVARGHGRPRLGCVQGSRFFGDAGEPCHPARWRAAGRVVATYSTNVGGWAVELESMVAIGGAGESPVVAIPPSQLPQPALARSRPSPASPASPATRHHAGILVSARGSVMSGEG
ncbi:MAG TPA: hypothetical protein ENK18_21730 [Deltaproteobacteria bacterium]|nr:hypothetical protein [Deltaproteobacteria bacterium]